MILLIILNVVIQMNDLDFSCAICGVNLFKEKKFSKHVIFDGKPAIICSGCNTIYTPSTLSKVVVTVKFYDLNQNILNYRIEEFSLNAFINNNFTESDIKNYTNKIDSPKLFKFLDKLIIINELFVNSYDFDLMVIVTRKSMNKCEICDKELDYNESIYFQSGTKKPVQICKGCSL